ncbi:MAG: ATP-binding protein [Deltaproteobacteria bacterium]|nr:ATP-binding protein [Deltaproteobacteria bacterium]
MAAKSFASLRSRAIFLVLLTVLPLFALILLSYLNERKQAIREVQRDELVAARNLATIQETLINNTRQLLTTLTQTPQVQQRDRAACNLLFAEVLKQCPYYAALAAADLNGWVFAGAPEIKEPVNFADRHFFMIAVQTQALCVGEPVLGRISNKYSINLSCPILDARGRVNGILTAGLDLEWLGGLLAKSDFPPGTAMGLIDNTGKVLFRYPEPLEYIGRMLPPHLIKVMAVNDEGVAEGEGLPGDKRLFAFARLPSPWQGLRVAIGLPRDWAFDRANRDLRRNLIWLAVVALVTMAAARFGANFFILQPVDKLLKVTRRLTHGDLAARSGGPYQPGELGQLSQAFDQMADSLQERDADLKKTAAVLQERVQDLAASNKELENFTYSVAHDLRAPLRAIGGFARVLLEDYADKLDAGGQRYLNIIEGEARKMGRLIDDLLDLARLGRKEMRIARLDMSALVQETLNELQAAHPERDSQIEIQSLPAAWGDRAMLRQVFENLLLNAIKFTKDRETALIQVSGWSEEENKVFCVRDNGVGFDMKYVDKLFGVFERLHPDQDFEGTGVGLAMAWRIIERHGGRMWAEGRPGEGAAFYFTLPNREVT